MPPLVLILCRNTSLQDSLVSFLSAAVPVATLGAATPAAALEALARHQPDLVVIDTLCQNRELVALVAEIKTHWPGARRLVLTDSPAEQETAKDNGVDGVLLWGFRADLLLATVQKLLGLAPTEDFQLEEGE